MNNIKVDEYIRTKNGYIGYIENINDFREPSRKYAVGIQKSDLIFIGEEDIKAHSPNIIDLIEIGDYVNGLLVHGISDFGVNVYMYGDAPVSLSNDEIKSIVTHQQFKAMEYEI